MRTLTTLLALLLCLPLAACDDGNQTYVDANVIRCDRNSYNDHRTVFELEDGTRFKQATGKQRYNVGQRVVVEISLEKLTLARQLTKLAEQSNQDPFKEYEDSLVFEGTVQGFIKDSNNKYRTIYNIDDGKGTRVISFPHGRVSYNIGDTRVVTLEPENYARARVRELAAQQLIDKGDDLAAMSDMIVPPEILAEAEIDDPTVLEGFIEDAQADAQILAELDEDEGDQPQTVAARYENTAREQIEGGGD